MSASLFTKVTHILSTPHDELTRTPMAISCYAVVVGVEQASTEKRTGNKSNNSK